jgi:hypothetical protein
VKLCGKENDMVDQYEIQAKNFDRGWDSLVEFSGKDYNTMEALSKVYERLDEYREAYPNDKDMFRLVHRVERVLA